MPGALLVFLALCLAAGATTVGELRCEYLVNPMGIDATQPRLSYVLASDQRDQRQTARQILVASSEVGLKSNNGDLWDSGKVESDQSIQVPYAGKSLQSYEECFWKVRVWDRDGKVSAWSKPARWTMGLLDPADWKGKWIGLDGVVKTNYLSGTSWIWFPEIQQEERAPVATRYFRFTLALPQDRTVKQAHLLITADNDCTVFVNGQKAGTAHNYRLTTDIDIAELLRAGTNVIAVGARNSGSNPNVAGLVGLLRVGFDRGEPLVIATDEHWKTSDKEISDWQGPGFDDANWVPAKNLGPVGMAPWGPVAEPLDRRLPARWLRKEFAVTKQVRRATVAFSGLGLSELYLNGKKVGDHVLSPGLTQYPKRVFYVTFDVTRQLRAGANAMGVVLGNGRFFAPRGSMPTATISFGFPKLLLQLRVDYSDGSTSEVVSDETWKLTANGPIRLNNEYDGEEYDARMESSGWSERGFDDSKWEHARSVEAPGGTLAAQMMEPIRVTGIIKPIAVTEPKPGVFIFDLGQNMVGWCRLKLSGPRGTRVSLRHAETLKPDGTLYLDNIRTAKVTDGYTLKGEGTEIYEPRFTYHGFRYVELRGFPGRPTRSTLEGHVVNDDLESAGEFACSQPTINRVYHNIVWGVRGNYRSIVTDCPQRDERQGWLGDRAEETRGETYLFNTAALHAKWLQDMADAQHDNGSVSDVCPSYWPLYKDDVTWPSTMVILPAALLDQFADADVVSRLYPGMVKWIDHMTGYVTNGIITKDNYGDWCVPPEDPALIHSKDPLRQTARGLLATSFFYHDLRLMARYAALLSKPDDAQRFDALAGQLKTAFNEKFFDRDHGYYDNGSQTSSVLPLGFGLVPDGEQQRVFHHLVRKITDETQGHVGTGLVGGQWLNRVLSDGGRPDVSYTFVTNTTYPSWGYMAGKGATTVWELWNGDTADPGMNSGNHVMLVGDLVIWLYEDLAGIQPDPAQPGFKHIIMRPQPLGDLKFVKATHRSPYGLIVSDWKKSGDTFQWQVTVPANTTATVYVPAKNATAVTEDGRPAAQARGVRALRQENGCAVFEIGSGKYNFVSR